MAQKAAMGEITITLKNQIGEIERVQAVVEDLARDWNIAERATFAIKLSLEEVLSNIINYAFQDQEEHEILVKIRAPDQSVVDVEVQDDGRPFDPLSAPPPVLDQPIEERPIGGLGIHLVQSLMDEVHYRHEGARNVLTMKCKAQE